MDCTWSLLATSRAQLGASWTPLGLNLDSLRRLFGSTWRLLGASWAQLGASKPHSKLNLASVGPHLSPQSRTPSSTWRLLGAIWPSKPQNGPPSRKITSNLPSSCPSRALQTFKKCGRVIKIRGSGCFAAQVLLDCNLEPLAYLEPLGRFLDSTWTLLSAS